MVEVMVGAIFLNVNLNFLLVVEMFAHTFYLSQTPQTVSV